MAIMMKRQLNEDEKQIILNRHGRCCYANGHAIPDGEKIHFDHIKAFVNNGATELNNIAPMCEKHNLEKGQLPLEDFRIKLRIEDFFKNGKRLTLKDLLKYLKNQKDISSFGEAIAIKGNDEKIIIENANFSEEFKIETCPLTGWKYFYGKLPVDILDSDDDNEHSQGLQPRYLIFDKVFQMFRHFQHYPVLQPSIGRIDGNKIVLFDGQHKAASLLWTGRRDFECKIYINPNLEVLNQANISAHDKFAQTRFFSSIMVLKLGAQFGKDFEDYKNTENGQEKTEQGFIEYVSTKDLVQTKAEIKNKFRSYLYNSILENDENKWKPLVSTGNRGSKEQPITLDMLTKSIFAHFLYTEPLQDNILSEKYKRDVESENIVRLMNLLFDKTLINWNPSASQNDTEQIKLSRMFSSKSIMAWSELFKDAISAKLEIYDTDEKSKVFYRQLEDSDFEKIDQIIIRLVNWQMWDSPKDSEIDKMISNNKSTLKQWLKDKGLSTGYLMGASE